jgi:thioredoxin reductase
LETVVVGAGPFGLAAASHLRAGGVDLRVFGEPMGFWKRLMPRGMLLRSQWDASHISDPGNALTLDRYQEASGGRLPLPLTLTDFVDYGEWFRKQAGIDVDARRVELIESQAHGFRLRLTDGEEMPAKRVIIATGLADFPWRPPQFQQLPRELASHSSENHDFSPFDGKRVIVVGAGQSALESAALLHEAGAEVEVIARADQIHWLLPGEFVTRHKLLRRFLYPPSDIGPPGLNWIVATPALFQALPIRLQAKVARRVVRPAGAEWLRPRLRGVRLSTGRVIVARSIEASRGLTLTLDDDTSRLADHLLLATGYRVEIARLPILSDQLRTALGGPLVLGRGFESAVPGLYFIGAAASYSFGPIMRFVAGTGYTARALAETIAPT